MNISLSGGFAGASPLLPSGPTAPGIAAASAGAPAEFGLLFASVEAAPAAASDLSLSAPAALGTNANMAEDAKLASSSLLASGVSALVARFITAPAEGKAKGSPELPEGEAAVLPDTIVDEQALPQPELSPLPETLGREHLPHIKTKADPEPAEVSLEDDQISGSQAGPASLPKPETQQPVGRPFDPVEVPQPSIQLGTPQIGQPIGSLQPEPIVSAQPEAKSAHGLTAPVRPALVAGATQQPLLPAHAANDVSPKVEGLGYPQNADVSLTRSAEASLASFTSGKRAASVLPTVGRLGPASAIDASVDSLELASGAAEFTSIRDFATAAGASARPAVTSDATASALISASSTEQRPTIAAPAVALPEVTIAAEAGSSPDIIASLPTVSTPVTLVQQPTQGGLQAAAPVQDAAPAPRADDGVERQLDMLKEGEWLDRLARDITATAGRDGLLKFKLHPETLGSLHVEVARGADGTSLRFTAESEAARALIADAQPRLLAEARAQGLRLAETHVDLGGSGAQQQANDRRGSGEAQSPSLGAAGAAEAAVSEAGAARNPNSERFA
jgi:flagellar hook-length control protein FliK